MLEYPFYVDLLQQTHLLIAGATGTGKSTVINGMIYTILLDSPDRKQMILVDPKRIELRMYANTMHCIGYASEKDDMYSLLLWTVQLMEKRYTQMQFDGLRKFPGSDIYVFIDEYADLMTTDRKRTKPLIQRLCQLGRSARIHCIVGSQQANAKIIDTEIKCNIDTRIALRTSCDQDSRNIIGIKDAAQLPDYGQCYYKKSIGIEKWIVPYYNENDLKQLAALRQRPARKRKRFFGLF